MSLTESQARQDLIDIQLAKAGWSMDSYTLIEEFYTGSGHEIREDRTPYKIKGEFVDYVLLDRTRKPIAVVEAKKTSRDELSGKRQAADYADQIKAKFGFEPFIFLTNGKEIQFWDRPNYPPRKISGFYNREDLERLVHQRNYSKSLVQIAPNPDIAGRDYQTEAIRRITEAVEKSHRKFLLVMATGTGKTRTIISVIDILLRAKRIQRVLFLADRRELVRQALGSFKEHLPNESIARVEGGEIPTAARIQLSTYPSMMQVYEQLSVGYYDVIVADESHRSIYNRYKAIFDWFDSLQIGLTATPTDFIDHNTFQLFECDDGIPTFNYSFEQAVLDEHLASYRVLQAQTNFQVKGIKAGQLPTQIQEQMQTQGLDLEELNFEGTDLEKKVTNTGTINSIVREFMEKCRKDSLGLPHKAIIFAVSHAHAKRLYESFNRLYPEYQRKGMAEIIDSHMERAENTLDDFKFKDMPRVAISIDMLDTGIDIPTIQTLLFAKPVFSRVKFWQMIGRGTRRYTNPLTGKEKTNFLIIDCWNNFNYFQLNPEGETEHPSEPLPVSLFRLRLEKRSLLLSKQEDDSYTISDLQKMLMALPMENVNIRPHMEEIQELIHSWYSPSLKNDQHLSQTIAPLLRYYWADSFIQIQFRVVVERTTVAYLNGETKKIAALSEKIKDSIRNLAENVREVAAVAEKRAWILTPGFWDNLDLQRLQELQDVFAPLMRFRQSQQAEMIELNLSDYIATRRWIVYGPSGEGAFVESYREKVEAHIKNIADKQPALIKLKKGAQLNDEDILMLSEALNQIDLFVTEDVLREVYQQPTLNLPDFMKHILNISKLPDREEQIKQAFEQFIHAHGFMSASQINFLRAIRAAVLRHAKISKELLYKPPLSRVGQVENLFAPKEIEEIINFANHLAEEAA
ncbi:type I restriction endonuclease subunit R [Desulfobacula phenolica]|uniref:Type I restriction enzyme, R subunit n=1 Tax=Desulfobacula phenolica TaxID=90732 RepID=A0A1H2I9W0_9BACT|nr:DEAD/DEAH box helicase family protein [Desulfobacula phenolica]SDU40927.1 type I restriction enzyme, R subunit [Desulfobacula phenolica]